MSGCRIGKVKFKTGGELQILPLPKRGHFQETIEAAGRSLSPETRAIGFFTLDFDGGVTVGYSYAPDTYISHMYGAVDFLRTDILKHWEKPEDREGA